MKTFITIGAALIAVSPAAAGCGKPKVSPSHAAAEHATRRGSAHHMGGRYVAAVTARRSAINAGRPGVGGTKPRGPAPAAVRATKGPGRPEVGNGIIAM